MSNLNNLTGDLSTVHIRLKTWGQCQPLTHIPKGQTNTVALKKVTHGYGLILKNFIIPPKLLAKRHH